MKTKNKNKGFTLIELLMVVSIIGLLSSIVMSSLSTAREKAKISKIVQEKHQADLFLELYQAEYGGYPYGPEGLYCIGDGSGNPCYFLTYDILNDINELEGITSLRNNLADRKNLLASVEVPRFKNDTTIKIGGQDFRGIIYKSCETPVTINSVPVCVQDQTTSAETAALVYFAGKSNSGGVALKATLAGSAVEVDSNSSGGTQ